ncbi:MAG: hypothetical protein JSC189_000230 [Candidatus Tokpelaia sp. JSC189]|nr:MAG: hypothetical protein JSC189_000230 [Candidatus Tokpelaia sp. JSC189]
MLFLEYLMQLLYQNTTIFLLIVVLCAHSSATKKAFSHAASH